MKFKREREIKNNTFITKISFKEFGGDGVYSAEDEARLVDDFGYPEVEIGFIKGTYEVESKEGKKHINVKPSVETVDRFHFGNVELVTDEEAVNKVVVLEDTADSSGLFYNVGFNLEIGYENIKSVEVRLFNEGNLSAYSIAVLDEIMKADESAGGTDGQLSCPFFYTRTEDTCWNYSNYKTIVAPDKVQVLVSVVEEGKVHTYIAEKVTAPGRSAFPEIVVCNHFRGCKKVDENFAVTCKLPIRNDEGILCDPSILSTEKLSEYEAKCRLFEETIIKRIHLALQDLYAKDTIFEVEDNNEIIVAVNEAPEIKVPQKPVDTHVDENIFIG